MHSILLIFEILIGIALIGAIILQMQGSGLSGAFGGSGEVYRSKRSIEKLLVIATGALAALFALVSLLLLIYR
jgi:preprotein translocase subunit SecG